MNKPYRHNSSRTDHFSTEKLLLSILLVCTINFGVPNAHARQGESPKSFSTNNHSKHTSSPAYVAGTIDPEKLRSANVLEGIRRKPLQVATPLDVEIELEKAGHWQQVTGGFVWRQKITAINATDLSLRLQDVQLPQGATLHLIAQDQVYFEGPYTAHDVDANGTLMTPAVPGDTVTLELFTPNKDSASFTVDRALAGFRDLFGKQGGPHLQKAGSCNNNAICPIANPHRNQVRATAMYVFDNGGSCTGTLIASADGATTPYFLTANHCWTSGQNPTTTTVYWNFESPICEIVGGGTLSDNQVGMTLRSFDVDVDFRLFELNNLPDESFNVFYTGWDRADVPTTASYSIHHPDTDEKAISFNDDLVTSDTDCTGGTVPDTHWIVDNWEDGTTEGGSSGSGLFSTATNHIVGILSGGAAACGNQGLDCYGKIAAAWDGANAGARLRDWLDPQNSGVNTTDGYNLAPRIEYDSHTGTDVCLSNSNNANGFWEPGEDIDVLVKIVGNESFSGVTGTLSTSSPGVSVVTPTVTYPNLTSGVARNSNTPFKIRLDSTMGPTCLSDLQFQVSVSSNEADPFSLSFENKVGEDRSPIVPWTIPDNTSVGPISNLVISNNVTITDLNVRVAIDHTAVGDLIITLKSPAGTEIVLLDRPGLPLVDPNFGCLDDNFNITFDDSSATDLENFCPGTTPWLVGDAAPASALSAFNGESTLGTWTITVSDNEQDDLGDIIDWEIITTPALPQPTCNTCLSAEIPDGTMSVADDINGNGSQEVLGFQVDALGNISGRIADANTGAVITNTNFLSSNWTSQGGFGFPPLPGETAPTVALVATQNTDDLPIIQLKSAANGNLIRNLFPWSSAWNLTDWHAVPGQAPGGNDALGILASRKSDGLMGLELRDPNNNNRIRIIYPLGLGWTPRASISLDVNGTPAVAVLATRDSDNLTIVQVRNASDGSLVRNVFPLGFGWSPTGEIKAVPDLNGNGVEEVATRMTRDADGLEIIQIRDGQTNDLVSNVYPIGAGGGGWTTQQFEVVTLAGTTYLGILSTFDATGQILVQTKNAQTAAIDSNLFFIGPPYEYHDYAVLEDFNGNGASELAVFVENTSTGLRLIQVRDGDSGALIRNVFQ
ncbi:MAG: proprotein convertase P-domain-containing protein [Pseudomonadota bacterium]